MSICLFSNAQPLEISVMEDILTFSGYNLVLGSRAGISQWLLRCLSLVAFLVIRAGERPNPAPENSCGFALGSRLVASPGPAAPCLLTRGIP